MPTNIQWTDETWNPVSGCTPISEACTHCYAKRMAKRLAGRYGYPKDDPFQITFHADKLKQPLKWKKPRRIFVCSMGDLFHERIKFYHAHAIFHIMAKAKQHIFMILTKRPKRMKEFFDECVIFPQLLHNVWLGVSVENQKRADERIPILMQIPAAIRFLSVEPMLDYIDLEKYLYCSRCGYTAMDQSLHGDHHLCDDGGRGWIHWVICGAETGPGARYMDPGMARRIRSECLYTHTPFFMKAMSNKEPIPDDLNVRQYPGILLY